MVLGLNSEPRNNEFQYRLDFLLYDLVKNISLSHFEEIIYSSANAA